MPMRHADGTQARAPNDARHLFFDVLDWLRNTYRSDEFLKERDLVAAAQKRLSDEVSQRSLPYQVVQECPIPHTNKRADLALLGSDNTLHLVIEFKYEPHHQRLTSGQIPVVFWTEVTKDIDRIRRFVNEGQAQSAFSVFVDEGGYYRHRETPPGGRWEDWDISGCDYRVAVLISEA